MIVAVLLAALSAVIVRWMIRVGTLDIPGARSSHTRPTPKGGGVGIVAAFVVGVAVHAGAAPLAAAGLAGGALLLAAVSYLDDLRSWPPAVKFAAQTAAALLAIGCGIRLDVLHLPWLGEVHAGWLGVPLTLLWILATTNAVNFIDGLNGLASGSVGIACVGLLAIAGAPHGSLVPSASVALAAGIAGFLPFNYPRARIFMGDVGSQACGFAIASLGVLAAGQSQPASALLVPLMLLGILFDVVFTLARRLVAGDRLTEAHRSHLYQIAYRAGMPAWQVSLVYWLMAAVGGGCAWALAGASSNGTAWLLSAATAPPLLWLCAVVWLVRATPVGRW